LAVIVVFWAAVVLLVLWIVLLAVADMVSTRVFFGRMRNNFVIEQARLRAAAHRLRGADSNGGASEAEKHQG
jgi:hypothetical protein